MNEATTVVRCVIPQLQSVGWEFGDIELSINNYDIVLLKNKEIVSIIEAKAFGLLNKTESAYVKNGTAQLRRYLNKVKIGVGYLTDGKSWFRITKTERAKLDSKQFKIELSKEEFLQIHEPPHLPTYTASIEDIRADGAMRSVKLTEVPNEYSLTKEEIDRAIEDLLFQV